MNLCIVPLVVAALVATVFLAPTAQGATPSTASLSSAGASVHWSGSLGTAFTTAPEACLLLECDEFVLKVNLPTKTWAKPGGVQIGIRWPDENQDLELHVYAPDGSLAASSTGFPSKSESVLLPNAANGDYRVVVVPANSADIAYEGVAQVERPAAVSPLRELLPNIVSLPPAKPQFATSGYLVDIGANPAISCYPEETVEQGARRCLRFDQVIANTGAGPLELRFLFETALTDGSLRQRIYRSDGLYRERLADTVTLHPAHAHFHYSNFAQAHLWRSDAKGKRIGAAPIRSGRKNGFCLIDVDNTWFGRRGDSARTYGAPACLGPTSGDDVVHGISVGWADIYNWFLADQFIEVTGVPDGHYLLESDADPVNTLIEEREDDNRATTHIQLCGDRAVVVGEQPGCV